MTRDQLITEIYIFLKNESFKKKKFLLENTSTDDLVILFNQILSHIYRYEEETKIYIQSVMHELRGLLTGIYFYLDIFKNISSKHNNGKLFHEIIERTKLISEKALLFSSIDQECDWYWDNVDIGTLLTKEIGALSYHERYTSIVIDVQNISIYGNPFALHFIIHNLLLNALDAACYGEVKISVFTEEFFVTVVICNACNNLSYTYKDSLQKNFVHTVEKNARGLGTGIFLTRKLMELHRGTMKIEESDTDFYVSLCFPGLSKIGHL